MGKLPLLKPLQICLSKFKGSKMCGHLKTQSFSLERGGECTSGEPEAYQSFNSVYVVSDFKPGRGGFESRESQRFVICYEGANGDGNGNYSCKSWFCEEEEVTSESSSYLSDFFSESGRSSELPAGLVSGLRSERFFCSPSGGSNSILEEAKDLLRYSVDGAQNNSSSTTSSSSSSSSFSTPAQREKIDLCAISESWDFSSSASDPSRGGDECEHEYVLQNPLALAQRDLGGVFLSDSVAVPMHSPNPYLDFRRSMQEMVEAHNLRDWSYLQEMLFCYLRLNKKKTHQFIVGAFADLVLNIVVTRTPLLEYVPSKEDTN